MKKIIFLNLLILSQILLAQETVNCAKKFNMPVIPEVNECEAAEKGNTGINQGYLECVCKNKKLIAEGKTLEQKLRKEQKSFNDRMQEAYNETVFERGNDNDKSYYERYLDAYKSAEYKLGSFSLNLDCSEIKSLKKELNTKNGNTYYTPDAECDRLEKQIKFYKDKQEFAQKQLDRINKEEIVAEIGYSKSKDDDYSTTISSIKKSPVKKKNISSKDKEVEKAKMIPDIDKVIDISVAAQIRYDDYKMEALKLQKSGKKDSESYKRLINLIRSEERLLNTPRHKTFDNPSFVNENTGNKYIDDVNRRINNIKQESDQIADIVSGTITSIIEANAYNKGMKERAKSLEYNEKQRKERLELEIKRQEEENVEKDLLESWSSKQLAASKYFLKISLDQQRTLEKLAPKFIDKIECPNLRCENGKIKIVTTTKRICKSCKGKKTLHNFGKGGGCWNGCKNYMSCLSCDGTGYEIVDKTSEDKCPLCKGDGHLLEYKGKGIIPHKELKNIYTNNPRLINQFSSIRSAFKKYQDLEFITYKDLGYTDKIGFIDRDMKTIIKPMFKYAEIIENDKSIVQNFEEYGVGVISSKGEIIIPMEYSNIVYKKDSLYLFKDEFIYKADKEGKNIISQKYYNVNEFKDKNGNIKYAIRFRNNKNEFVDNNNNILSDSISNISYSHDKLGKAHLLKLYNKENKPYIFDPYTNTLSNTYYDDVRNTKKKNGFVILSKNGKKGFYYLNFDKSKNKGSQLQTYISEVIYDEIKILYQNSDIELIKVNLPNNPSVYGIMNGKGKWILRPEYDMIEPVRESEYYKPKKFIVHRFGEKERRGVEFTIDGKYIGKVRLPKSK